MSDRIDVEKIAVREVVTPAINANELREAAQSLVSSGSLLDGIREPLNPEEIKTKVFKSCLQDLARVADALGYGWVSGRTSQYVGEGYRYVPTGGREVGAIMR